MLDVFKKYDKPENYLANCIRFLTVDAINSSKSGHPGMPMGMADIMTVLYQDFLVFNPNDAKWQGRDRVVISNGHGSMLLYSLLYLTGYSDISLDDIRNFRQINSKATGHPEIETLMGVEASTGLLGQGIANAVGMALSSKIALERYGLDCFKHKVYCTVGDGCLMEGISQEAITFASHYNLNNLVVIFDDNEVTIDGNVNVSTSENQFERFKTAGWECFAIDGHDIEQIRNVFQNIQNSKSSKPFFINAKTIIGFGDEKNAKTSKVHGGVINEENINEFRKFIGFSENKFEIPENLLTKWRGFWKRNEDLYKKYQESGESVKSLEISNKEPKIKKILQTLDEIKDYYLKNPVNVSTRKAMSLIINNIGKNDLLLYGSADLGESTMVKSENHHSITNKSYRGEYINFGIREHSMAAISNGIVLDNIFIQLCGTFLVFADYMKPAIRMSAMMKQNVIYIFTHDSIFVGEDGPTHQPIEQLTMLRSIPNLQVFRPCDIIELIECFKIAIQSNLPSAFILSRQDLTQIRTLEVIYHSDQCQKGGYIINSSIERPNICIIATGSEVQLAIEVAKDLRNQGKNVNVISMPCISLFEMQPVNYKQSILPEDVKVFAIEAGIGVYFDKYITKSGGKFFGVEEFGRSGKIQDIAKHFKLTAEEIGIEILNNI